MGYTERFLDIDYSLKQQGRAGYLTDKQRAEWQEKLGKMETELHAVQNYLPESYSGHLSEAAWRARRAGHDVAALEIDVDREERLRGPGILNIAQEAELEASAENELKGIRNNLSARYNSQSR